MSFIDKFFQMLFERDKKQTSPIDAVGEVTKIEDGIAWVTFDKGEHVTPVTMGISCDKGDNVRVRMSGGDAYIIGNESRPPTDDTGANKANDTALEALKRIAGVKQIAEEAIHGNTENAEHFAEAIVAINSDIENLQEQIDGNITSWFYDVDPAMNLPPVTVDPDDPDNTGWDTDDKKNNHLGDLYYNVDTGKVWRFVFSSGAFSWSPVEDSDVTRALEMASRAQDTADNKRRVFVTTPVPPYDVGDLWVQGSNGDILRCAQAKATGGAYSASDWIKASKYTDDSALTTWISGDFADTISELEEGITDAKVETYYQSADPSTNWSATQKAEHAGDFWYNTSTMKYYRYSGNAWQEVKATPPDAVFDKIDGKASIYVGSTTPVNPQSGDLWLKSANDDILTYVNGSWVKYNKYTDDTTAQRALTSANGKNKVFHQASQPTGGTYVNGDTWFDTDDGYKMYTYNGSAWVAEEFGNAALADLSITNAKIANATIQSGKIQGLDVGKLTGGYIDASHINAGAINIGQSQVAGLVTDLAGKADTSDIPTDLSDLNNDTGYITSSSVPTKVSQLTNDSGYQNSTQVNNTVTSKGYQTSAQVESAITGKGYQTSEQVEDAITEKGYQTSSQVESAITGKGYQTSTQVESAITSKGYQTSSQVESAITSKGYQTASQVNSAISSGITGKADKTVVIKSVVSVFYRSTTSTTPSKPTASTTIGTSADTDDAWEYVMPQPKRGLYFFTCERYTFADNNVAYSTVRAIASETYASKWVSSNDNTFIDGGRIYANSITASQIKSNTITASQIAAGTITATQIDTSTLQLGESQITNLTTHLGQKADASSVPTKVSQLTNDSSFATTTQVNTAKSDAISTAASDATTKANNAKSSAISTAASDATTKANNAKADAISTAASDATTKANNAKTAAISAAATDATSKANEAAKTASSYIGVQTDGIKVAKNVASATSYTLITDSGFHVYKSNKDIANFTDNGAYIGYVSSTYKKYIKILNNKIGFYDANYTDPEEGYIELNNSSGYLDFNYRDGYMRLFNDGAQVQGKLTADAINNSLFVTSTSDVFASSPISGSSHKYGTTSVSKSKYYPLGIVGWNSPDTSAFVPSRLRLSAQSTGSATISYDVRNTSSSSATGKFTADILWLRVTV